MVVKFFETIYSASREVLSNSFYSKLFIALLILLGFVYAVLTDVFVLSLMQFNPIIRQLDVLLIAIIALLAALTTTLTIYRMREFKAFTKRSSTGFFGSVVGFFATACPVCTPIWLSWLGVAGSFAFLTQASLYIELASIALLAVSLYLTAQAVNKKSCEIK